MRREYCSGTFRNVTVVRHSASSPAGGSKAAGLEAAASSLSCRRRRRFSARRRFVLCAVVSLGGGAEVEGMLESAWAMSESASSFSKLKASPMRCCGCVLTCASHGRPPAGVLASTPDVALPPAPYGRPKPCCSNAWRRRSCAPPSSAALHGLQQSDGDRIPLISCRPVSLPAVSLPTSSSSDVCTISLLSTALRQSRPSSMCKGNETQVLLRVLLREARGTSSSLQHSCSATSMNVFLMWTLGKALSTYRRDMSIAAAINGGT
mmetsp:Transcript_27998/g.80392  ORF Transcript_27998/g.80392 Transcript_27998/m.80392 type:complete len:264 (-) Transcript_27998:381-1172(-)